MKPIIIVRGGGDLATATIHRLHRAGFPVLVLETHRPAAIRRQVCFSEAVYQGSAQVEGVTARLIREAEEAVEVWNAGEVPLLVDPEGTCIPQLRPAAVVDAILAKRNLGTHQNMAPLTIALGPGFTAGQDVHFVIETMRGHNLGRIITEGTALPNTGVPGLVGGASGERVIHADYSGTLQGIKSIGQLVEQGEPIAMICNQEGEFPVEATITGLLRGLIRDGFPVTKGLKIADIDPRQSEEKNCFTISDKARCIAGSVLELVCRYAR